MLLMSSLYSNSPRNSLHLLHHISQSQQNRSSLDRCDYVDEQNNPTPVGADLSRPYRYSVNRPQPLPMATTRVPAPHHPTPALTKTTKRAVADPCLCMGGGREDEGMGPLRSPLGGALLLEEYVH